MNEPAKVIWRPVDDGADTPMAGFAATAGDRWQRDLGNWDKLHAWSVSEREEFWQSVWDQCGIVGTMGSVVLEQGDAMPGARFFPEARLNFAENLLAHAGEDDEPALIFRQFELVDQILCPLDHGRWIGIMQDLVHQPGAFHRAIVDAQGLLVILQRLFVAPGAVLQDAAVGIG